MSRRFRFGRGLGERLLALLLGGPVFAAACGSAPALTPSDVRAVPSTVPIEAHTEQEASDSLGGFRSRLATGRLGVSQLNLAAKGWGPGLGPLLGESAAVESLISLDVSDNALGIIGARALVSSAHLAALRELDLGGNDIGDDGATAIANAKTLTALQTLNVSGNSIRDAGTRALVGGGAPKLSSLDLSMNGIGAGGAAALGRAELPLTSLYLLGCEIGPSGLKELTSSKHLSSLRVLALSGNDIGDDGARALSRSTALKNLATLDLCANGIGDAGALALAQSPRLKNLQVLELFGNDIGSRGARALRKRFGKGLHM
jgi:Ran GTPase-activating protein (RanGAP) involved in mRNA processing and transport